MKTLKFIFVLFLFSTVVNKSHSQVSTNFQKLELSNKILGQNTSETFGKKLDLDNQAKVGEKSPYLGALFSGIIPGAGEFYAKNYLKAGIFFAIEAGLWTAYSIFQNKGDDQTAIYQNFANQNWDVYQYAAWLKSAGGGFTQSGQINLNAPPNELLVQINICERANNFSHTLPAYGEQQYYELIGKYQTFVAGWKDADLNLLNANQTNYHNYKSPMFINYAADRQEANKYYDKGTTTLTIVILNHVLSAADAAWTVSMFNKNLKVKTGFHMENKYSYTGERKLIPVANVNVTF